MDTSIKRCEADSPNRCTGATKNGQCPNQAMEIGEGKFATHCSIHGGVMEVRAVEGRSQNMYRLAKYGQRVNELANHSGVKGLRDEIGILRMVLEEKMNQIKDESDLVLMSGQISSLVTSIEKTVVSCNKLEMSMGQMLDKQQIIQFAEMVIRLVGEYVTDPAALEALATKIGDATEEQLKGNAERHQAKKEGRKIDLDSCD